MEAALGGPGPMAQAFSEAYNLSERGNCVLSPASDPHGELRGRNVPILLRGLASLAAQVRGAVWLLSITPPARHHTTPHQRPVVEWALLRAARLQRGVAPQELQALLADARHRLHAARLARPPPALDTKRVAALQGMGISAFALASRVLTQPLAPCFPDEGASAFGCLEAGPGFHLGRWLHALSLAPRPSTPGPAARHPTCAAACPPSVYLDTALALARFVRDELWDGARRRLRHSTVSDVAGACACACAARHVCGARRGRASYCLPAFQATSRCAPLLCWRPAAAGFADDYAQVVAGLLDLYECGGGVEWLQLAVEVQVGMDEAHWDERGGGYLTNALDDPTHLSNVRLKDR